MFTALLASPFLTVPIAATHPHRRASKFWYGLPLIIASLLLPSAGQTPSVTESVLHSFTPETDGYLPYAGLITDAAGNLYGTTSQSSTNPRNPVSGVVFRVSPAGQETLLHSFAGGADGAFPTAPLIANAAGNFYGTAPEGGDFNLGVIFRIAPDGTETVLHSFSGADGANPLGGVIFDSAGNLYGTTNRGGGAADFGTVFKLTPTGVETVLHSFLSGSDGAYPEAGLVAGVDGALYGTTTSGGIFSGLGTAFRITTSGVAQVLHSFGGGLDGAEPHAPLIVDSAGNLYGTTASGGTNGYGTVYRLAPGGGETVLYSFTSLPDGAAPFGALLADSTGALYGTTYGGGAHNDGTVFRLSPDGTKTLLYSFGGADGANPYAGLVADAVGNLYGTTLLGGASSAGTVFKLAGSGFVAATPFSSFEADLAFSRGDHPHRGDLALVARFSLGKNSNGIHPASEPLILQIGTLTVTLPSGSFTKARAGYYFDGSLNGATYRIVLVEQEHHCYRMLVLADGVDLSTITNPVTVTVRVGDDTGTATVRASLHHRHDRD